MTVKDLLGDSPKKSDRKLRFIFKSKDFAVECDGKYERLDTKKLLPFEEYNKDKTTGKRVIKKLVGYKRGEGAFFEAMKNEKGKWVADTNKPVNESKVEKVVEDIRTGKATKKDTLKGLWFKKLVPSKILSEWQEENRYCLWLPDNADSALKVWEFLRESDQAGVYKFNPTGTAYHAFLQAVKGDRPIDFGFILIVARVKVKLTHAHTITDANAREREKDRTETGDVISALEEI